MLSMTGLSYGVVRVDTGEKLSVLTVQDVGQVMPGGEHPPATDDHGGRSRHPEHSERLLETASPWKSGF